MLWTDGWAVGQTDGRSGPTIRPAFAKATQVINVFRVTSLKILSMVGTHFLFNIFLWKKI